MKTVIQTAPKDVLAKTSGGVPLFSLGQVVTTPGAWGLLEEVANNPERMAQGLLARHVRGDYGELDLEDWRENDKSVRAGFRILSSYTIAEGPEGNVWVITEADRSATTFLLPSEY